MKKWIHMIFVLSLIGLVGFAENVKAAELLKVGSESQEVYDIQATLKTIGYFPVAPTGYYGSITERAVKDFQYETGLLVDGIVGVNTRNQLDNIEMMARVIHGEARGESYEGKVAVAAVILNRVGSSHFPNTIANVILQPNAFTAVSDGQYFLPPVHDDFKAAIDAMNGWDPTHGSTYYYNPRLATNQWIFTRERTGQIGNHVFAE